MRRLYITSLTCLCWFTAMAQKPSENLIYIDKQGVVRFTKDNKEAAFFGVNYTVPFAYGYRSHKALGVDLQKAISADVYHMWRLGLDAFRVHVWDVEISDSLGNLLENEHLRLFDYLLAQLKKRNIKILITPIAFWGNGYPERDERTPGFSSVYGKRNAVVSEAAIKAQENYVKQLFLHVNPYTGRSYRDDPDIIAAEINNEPFHSGPKEKVTEYIDRLAAAIRSTGWTKPVFYNISESPAYADAVVKAKVDGYSFQWYPTGLVANREQKGNYLPHVDLYKIPFGDTIPGFRNKPLMSYEFDAGDILQSNMYPAMARSFRTAGFWWATQFAYDPTATAYANTEYQTHYLNLVYTPSKAISLLIASKVFHRLPRNKSYGSFPADTLFDVFRVSYKNDLSEMNSGDEFYYSNSTQTQPKNIAALKHVAGVGSSAVIDYTGTGAYFLDKVEDGHWRLEVMPHAITIRDPFAKASPRKEVVRTDSRMQRMHIRLPDLGDDFSVIGIGSRGKADRFSFEVKPGVYNLGRKEENKWFGSVPFEKEFPKPYSAEPFISHTPLTEVSLGKPFSIVAKIVGVDTADKVLAELHTASNKWKSTPMQRANAYEYKAEVPVDMTGPGLLYYRIIIQKANKQFYTFPGGFRGDPYAWDEYRNETWQTFIAAPGAPLQLFNPNTDRTNLVLYNPDWRNNSIEYITSGKPGQLVMKASMYNPAAGSMMGWQLYVGDKLQARASELSEFTKLVISARSTDPVRLKISLINTDARAFAAYADLHSAFTEIEIPLASLKNDSMLLLPRPYPGFLPLWFKSGAASSFKIDGLEKLELSFTSSGGKASGIELESVWLKK